MKPCDLVRCPNCDSDNVHHTVVEVFDRSEDSITVRKTVVRSGDVTTTTVPSDESGNPSVRRHGLRVHFFCEQCPFESIMNIAQHKGQTLLSWTA